MTKQYFVDDIKHFVSAMNIKQFGTDKMYTLAQQGLLRTPADVYTLTKEQLVGAGISMRNANMVLYYIRQSKLVTMPTLLTALNIKGLGIRKTNDISRFFNSLGDLYYYKDVDFLCTCKFISMQTAKSIVDYFNDEDNILMMKQLESHGIGVRKAA